MLEHALMPVLNSKFLVGTLETIFFEVDIHLRPALNHLHSLSPSRLKNSPADRSLLLIECHLAIKDLLPADPRLLDHALQRLAIKWGNLVAEEHGLLVNLELGLVVEYNYVAIKPDIDVALLLLQPNLTRSFSACPAHNVFDTGAVVCSLRPQDTQAQVKTADTAPSLEEVAFLASVAVRDDRERIRNQLQVGRAVRVVRDDRLDDPLAIVVRELVPQQGLVGLAARRRGRLVPGVALEHLLRGKAQVVEARLGRDAHALVPGFAQHGDALCAREVHDVQIQIWSEVSLGQDLADCVCLQRWGLRVEVV